MAREIETTNFEPVSVEVTTPAFEAYARFREDYENSPKCAVRGSMSDSQTGRVGTISDAAVDKMAVVWLAEKYKELGRDITRADIESGASSGFDSLMAESALKQFETIKHAKFNHEGGFLLIGSREKDVLTGKDIDKTLQGIENQRRSLDLVAPLFANNGALFDKLAEDHEGKRSINYWDLKDARKADDRARAKGDRLYTDEERQAIDNLFKKWGSSDMRRIEHRGQSDTMGCDGLLNYDTVAKGAGFENPEEIHAAANAHSGYLADFVQNKCETEASNMATIQEARRMQREEDEAIEKSMNYTVRPGQGYDRIARDVLKQQNGLKPQESSVVQFSEEIANLNGTTRARHNQELNLHPGQTVRIHDDEWKMGQLLESRVRVHQYLNDNLNLEVLDQVQRGR
jgi:hypothetical protein